MRKATEDALARTEAERWIGEEMAAEHLIDESTTDLAGAGRKLLRIVGKVVEFERGTSKDPDKNVVPMRRVVITGPWLIDPDGVVEK